MPGGFRLQRGTANIHQLRSTFLKNIQKHSKAANRELAQRLLGLPLELRRIVYTDLWLSEPGYLREGPTACYEFGRKSMHLLCTTCLDPPWNCMNDLPHFVNLNSMDRQVAGGLLGHLKQVKGFNPHTDWISISGPEMEAFMTQDIYQFGTTLEVILSPFDLDFGLSTSSKRAAPHGVEEINWHKDCPLIKAAAEAISQMPSSPTTREPSPTHRIFYA
jgi:hypothetical protein